MGNGRPGCWGWGAGSGHAHGAISRAGRQAAVHRSWMPRTLHSCPMHCRLAQQPACTGCPPAAMAPLSMPAATLLPRADDSLPSAPSARFMGAYSPMRRPASDRTQHSGFMQQPWQAGWRTGMPASGQTTGRTHARKNRGRSKATKPIKPMLRPHARPPARTAVQHASRSRKSEPRH